MRAKPSREYEIKDIEGRLCLVDGETNRVVFVLHKRMAHISMNMSDVVTCDVSFVCVEPDK